MLEYIDNFEYGIGCSLKPTETELVLPPEAIKQLNTVMKGNHVYIFPPLTDKVPVERDVEVKGSKNFPMGSCAKVQWNKLTMEEYIAQRGK